LRITAALDGADLHFFGTRVGDGDIARHAFLQQQFTGLDHRLAMEACAHLAVLQGIGDGDDGHALMVRHVIAHDDERLAIRQACRSEVQRFEEAVAPERTHLRHAPEVLLGASRVDHGREPGGIGRDHQIFRQPSLEAQARHAEVGVLVGELHVAGVIGRFRNAPGRVVVVAIFLLALHDQTIGLLQQAARRGAHDE